MNEADILGYVQEPVKRVPVLYDADVAVAGSGTASTVAAIAAGRCGARTLVVDRFGQIGGNIGPGLWGGGSLHLALTKNERVVDSEALLNRMGMGGIPEEFHRRVIFERPNAEEITDELRCRLEVEHYNIDGWRMGTGGALPGLPGYLVDSNVCSHVALQMMEEAGVELMLSAYVADPIMEGNTVKGFFVESKSGRVAVRAKVVIDGTGQAEMAMRAGAPVKKRMYCNLGLWFLIGHVDRWTYERFCDENRDASPGDIEWARTHLAAAQTEADPAPALHPMLPAIREAWEAGEFQFRRKLGSGSIHITAKGCVHWPEDRDRPAMFHGRTGTAGDFDFSEAKVVTQMEREHREHAYKYARFLRKYIPGFESSHLLFCSPFLGARGGRTIDAVYPISGDDLTAERRFDDVIYMFNEGRSGKECDVPYRALLPREVDGLIATGKSAMPYGPNFRARCNMFLNGQAAGVAAALCAKDGVQPRGLDVKKLQRLLVDKLHCPLAEEERLKELGLR